MRVEIAGYNIDSSFIDLVEKKNCITPETISAAYARISRSKKSVDFLRQEAILDVEKARNSNTKIAFEMGHSSIAEHTVFNIDIIDVSRLLTEYIQKSRIASFTEKSQRYVKLEGNFYLPKEIQNTDLEKEFVSVVNKQNELYLLLMEKAKRKLEQRAKKGSKKEIYGRAKEDARYFLGLCTYTQMGMSINARSLGRLLLRLDKVNLIEAQELKKTLEEKVKKIAPSLIKYTKSDSFDRKKIAIQSKREKISKEKVELIYCSEKIDEQILNALFVETGSSYMEAKIAVQRMKKKDKEIHYNKVFEDIKQYSTLPRAFEYSDFIFKINCSSTCFAQLKRHRISSIVRGKYSPKNGFVVPKLIKDLENEKEIEEIIFQSESLWLKLERIKKGLGAYILTNSHKMEILFKANLREVYHFSRLRSDKHAQWEIREISKKIDKIVKKMAPLSGKMIGGKSEIF